MATKIEQADFVEWLRGRQWLFENGFLPKYHAIIGDPPYALIAQSERWSKADNADSSAAPFQRHARGFMGQVWDGFDSLEHYQQWATEWGRLALSAVYPGALGLFFGGTRTFHRLAVGLEDAGWQVVDCLSYIYASGFPKSLSIGKAIDKAAGAEREVIGKRYDGVSEGAYQARVQFESGYRPNLYGNDKEDKREIDITAPATPAAAQWEGHGTALKPAYEAILVCRAPRAGNTFANLALEYGTGSFNIDAGRIAGETWKRDRRNENSDKRGGMEWGFNNALQESNSLGRFPSNVLFAHAAACTDTRCVPECPVKQLGDMSGESSDNRTKRITRNPKGTNGIYGEYKGMDNTSSYPDTGTAARYFFAAKSPTFEREAGLDGFEYNDSEQSYGTIRTNRGTGYDKAATRRNIHPTVKPIQLTEYLARLILPPPLDTPRRLLIPFAGVASEMIGAVLAGWDEITGIEREAQYIPIAEARLKWWSQFPTYDKAKEKYDSIHAGEMAEQELINAGQLPLFDELR